MTEQTRTHAEAQLPRSTSRWIDPHGAQHLITVPAPSVKELLERLDFLGSHLIEHGWAPDGARSAPANGNGGDAPHCLVHGAPMKRSQHFAGWYCSKKNAGGEYCKEKILDKE